MLAVGFSYKVKMYNNLELFISTNAALSPIATSELIVSTATGLAFSADSAFSFVADGSTSRLRRFTVGDNAAPALAIGTAFLSLGTKDVVVSGADVIVTDDQNGQIDTFAVAINIIQQR